MSNKPMYDDIAEEYKESKTLPFRCIEKYTLFKLLGDLKGKKVVDLACGEGIYSRIIKEKGAASVLGVDISPEMIKLAEKAEKQKPLGCEYLVHDVLTLDTIGSFDIAFASFLLNYSKTKEELIKFCQVIYKNLAPNGRVVGVNDNPQIAKQLNYRKYDFTRVFKQVGVDGSPITWTFFLDENTEFSITNYYFSPETYAEAFKTAGFRDFQWQGPWISEQDAKNFPKEYWDDFFQNPPFIGFEASK